MYDSGVEVHDGSHPAVELGFRRNSAGKWQNDHILLTEHPSARNQAVARHPLSPGTTIVRDLALSTVLMPDQKGSRCDTCFRRSQNALKRCSGCVEYWYCGPDCQTHHWRAVHKHMCKMVANFRISNDFQASLPHRQMDAFLLSHLVSEHGERLAKEGLPREDLGDSLATFASLIRLPTEERPPIICTAGKSRSLSSDMLSSIYSRFGNNNFIVHSHLAPVGHGIFPLASRLFNHSCMPNAVVTYDFGVEGVCMMVKVLTEIQTDGEISIPYFDPALPLKRRQEICRFSYGFDCACVCCIFCKSIGPIPKPPVDPAQRTYIERSLLRFAFPDMNPAWPSEVLSCSLPAQLNVVLHEDFLPRLSKIFRDAAHDGPYQLALRSGVTLLALYVVLYPPYYPQTGVHCLELAKTLWNALVQGDEIQGFGEESSLLSARRLLVLAMDSLSVLGQEGDEDDGPMVEAATLSELFESS